MPNCYFASYQDVNAAVEMVLIVLYTKKDIYKKLNEINVLTLFLKVVSEYIQKQYFQKAQIKSMFFSNF